jgi:hypothetical protein
MMFITTAKSVYIAQVRFIDEEARDCKPIRRVQADSPKFHDLVHASRYALGYVEAHANQVMVSVYEMARTSGLVPKVTYYRDANGSVIKRDFVGKQYE